MSPFRSSIINWKHDSLVMIKWFSSLAAYTPKSLAVERVMKLEGDPLFLKEVPNYLRSLYLQFAKNNLTAFHDVSGKGYEFMAERIRHVDSFNPQVASRTAGTFAMIKKLDPIRQEKMRNALDSIMAKNPSKDTFEVVSKYLAP